MSALNRTPGPKSQPTKRSLSPARRRLVELMQEINFGRSEGLAVRGGDPVLAPPPRLVREVKFGGDNGPRPERGAADFDLKARLVELLDYLDEAGDVTIDLLEVKHGLPFRMLVADPGA
jgi:hypothetical protein